MREIIKNILETLSDNRIGVTVQRVCINNRNVRREYIYEDDGMTDNYKAFFLPYEEIVTDDSFIQGVAAYLWNNCPKSKGVKPKVLFPSGQLNYEEFEDLKIDLKNFIKASIDDNELEHWIGYIYQRNMIPDMFKASNRTGFGIPAIPPQSVTKIVG